MPGRDPTGVSSAIHADVVPSFARQYDQRVRVACTRAYVICSTPRSGSTLLCQGLWDLGTAGRPAEYFNERHIAGLMRRWRCHSVGSRLRLGRRRTRWGLLLASQRALRRYARELLARRSTDNGVFGVKLHHSQHEQELGGLPLQAVLPEPRYVLITREDRLRQAISLSRAQQTNRYRHADPAAGTERYDFERLCACQAEVAREVSGWERYFEAQGVSPLRISYESLTHAYEATVFEVARFVGASVPATCRLPEPRLRKQADHLTEAWLERLEHDLRQRRTAGPWVSRRRA